MTQKLTATARRQKAIRDKRAMMSEHGKKKKRENQVKRRKAIKDKDYDHKDGKFKTITANRGNDGKGTKKENNGI